MSVGVPLVSATASRRCKARFTDGQSAAAPWVLRVFSEGEFPFSACTMRQLQAHVAVHTDMDKIKGVHSLLVKNLKPGLWLQS